MPPRPALHRVATILLGLLYFLAWGEPVALHPCPMHDGAGVAVVDAGGSGAAARHAVDGPHHGHAAEARAGGAHGGGAHATVAPVDHGAPADHGTHLCQCLGHGCCAAAVTVPARQQVRWLVLVSRRADPPADAPALPRATAPRFLPPATGPPALG